MPVAIIEWNAANIIFTVIAVAFTLFLISSGILMLKGKSTAFIRHLYRRAKGFYANKEEFMSKEGRDCILTGVAISMGWFGAIITVQWLQTVMLLISVAIIIYMAVKGIREYPRDDV